VFARLRAAVLTEAHVSEAIDGPISNIRLFEIQEGSYQTPKQWHDRLALLGCAFVGFVIMFVLVAGVWTIIGWFE